MKDLENIRKVVDEASYDDEDHPETFKIHIELMMNIPPYSNGNGASGGNDSLYTEKIIKME